MLTIIKSAIITIVLSFVSGVLLDTYKNLAPRIVCSMGKGISIVLRNKKIRAYTLTIKNISNKTIHDLTLNVQGHYDNLRVDDAKITRGLRFDASNEDNIYCVNIPFLSKDDEFTVKLFVERVERSYKKPVITLRSPENFKKIESEEENGFIASLLNVPENIGNIFKGKISKDNDTGNSKKESSFSNKKVVAAIVSIILIIFVAAFGIQHYADKNKAVNNAIKTSSSQESNNSNNISSTPANNSKNKQSQDKSKNNSSNNNSATGGTNNASAADNSKTPADNKSQKQPTNKPESKSQPSDSDKKSEEGQSSGEGNQNANNSSLDNKQNSEGKKESGDNKNKENTGTKDQTKNEKTNEGGKSGDTTNDPSKTKAN